MNERLSTQPGKKMPSQDFIAAERQSPVRHEYINGQAVSKMGGNRGTTSSRPALLLP